MRTDENEVARIARQFGFPTFNVKGISVAAVDLALASNLICQYASNANGEFVTVTGAHGIVESAYDERILHAHQMAFMTVPDGMPLVWVGKLMGFRSMSRVYGPDLMEHVFANEQYRRLRHFFYGANPPVISKLRSILEERYGHFNFVGAYSPPVRQLGFAEQDEVIARIRDLKPDLVWVGLSTPKQEIWMQMHMPRIGAGLAIGVGAAFDLLSGTIAQAPRWIQRSGFEWLFRLLKEPRRLLRRYAFVVPRFLFCLSEVLAQHWSGMSHRRERDRPI
jgi:N-acetylglucosaminyldiphosphoundecaprenol N-acetyl-beta-D-mannosaminyltransferase